MTQYATLSFKISGVRHNTRPSDNYFSIAQSQSNIHGTCSGNTGNCSSYGSYNTTFVLPGVADFGVRNHSSLFEVGEAGIIRIPK